MPWSRPNPLPRKPAVYCSGEWKLREGLAACTRLAVVFKLTDTTLTHITARVRGPPHFLIDPCGLMFHEVTASKVIKIDLDGKLMEESEWPVNRTGYVIHSAAQRTHKHLHCVVHNHSLSGLAVSAQKEGLPPGFELRLLHQGHGDQYGRRAFSGHVSGNAGNPAVAPQCLGRRERERL